MRIEQLIYLRAILRENSFSDAADTLFISQGALSKSIRSLEDELHTQLLIRHRDNISLTPAGAILYDHIEKILEYYEKLSASADAISPSNLIRVATFHYMSYCGIAHAIVAFERNSKDMIVETHECTHGQMISSLLNGAVDYCIGFSELWEKQEGLSYIPIKKDKLGIVVGKKHPFSSHSELRFEDMHYTKFCFMREDPELFRYIIDNLALHNLYPNLTKSNVRLETIKEYVLAGMRATIHVESLLNSYFNNQEFSHVDLSDAPELTLTIAYNSRKINLINAQFIIAIAGHFGVEITMNDIM